MFDEELFSKICKKEFKILVRDEQAPDFAI